jgi:murein DD-endopeptidase MepM/ murein hydrolase activator NlpD
MANFADLIRYQKSQGKGTLGSLASAVGQRTLEKIDPRNYLFNRKGAMTALFPGVKGYQAKTASDITKFGSTDGGISNVQVEEIATKLEKVGIDLKIVAKNSIVLPHLARDMNVVRQNIVKLVKSKQVKPSQRADMFFLRSQEREAAYEAQQDKVTNTTKPTVVKKDGEAKEQSFLDKMLNFLGKFTIGNILGWLLQGAAILTILNFIGKLILEKDFRQAVWSKFDELMKSMGSSGDSVVKNVAAALGTIAAVMMAYQVAVNLAIAGLKAFYARVMTKGAGGAVPGDQKGKKGKGKTPTPPPKAGGKAAFLSSAAAVALPFMFSSSETSAAQLPTTTPTGPGPTFLPSMEQLMGGEMDNSMSPTRAPTSDGSMAGFALPVASGRFTSPFGRRFDSSGNHEGVDIALPINSEITSIGPGVVSAVGVDTNKGGKYVFIKHDNGLESRYFHLNDNTLVKKDQKVDKNTVIGLSGNTGKSEGPHLHLEVRKNGKPVHPGEAVPELAGINDVSQRNMVLARGNTNGERALALGTNTVMANAGNTTYNIDNRNINTLNQVGSQKSEVAEAEDQLFKMLFMTVV